jgi:NTE family protein
VCCLSSDFNLILSGGAALGYAHIGVLEYLHEKELTPNSFHGVSMGAIVSAVEATELTFKEKQKLYEDVFSSLKWIKLSLDGNLISTKKIEKILSNIFKDKKIKDLSKELNIIATNYHDGSMVIFDKDSDIKVVDAVLASMAVPAVFPSREIDGKLYVDG